MTGPLAQLLEKTLILSFRQFLQFSPNCFLFQNLEHFAPAASIDIKVPNAILLWH